LGDLSFILHLSEGSLGRERKEGEEKEALREDRRNETLHVHVYVYFFFSFKEEN